MVIELTKSETHVTEATSFILELLRKRNVKQNLEVFSEIILIAKILHQRFRETDGIKVKKNISIELAKKEILKTVEKDQYYNLLKQYIKDYFKNSFFDINKIFKVSTIKNEGIDSLKNEILNLNSSINNKYSRGVFRMFIDRSFLKVGFGHVVTGTVSSGKLKAPIVIGRDHLDAGSVASPNRETEAMKDGSDAVADWPILNALLSAAGGSSWTSVHHGGGVGMGLSIHAGVVIVADGSIEMEKRLNQVLTNDPGIGVARHVDAGYEYAKKVAKERNLKIPMLK